MSRISVRYQYNAIDYECQQASTTHNYLNDFNVASIQQPILSINVDPQVVLCRKYNIRQQEIIYEEEGETQ